MSEEKKVVLITGAAMGQGRAHAVKYAQNGFNVVVADMLDVEDARFQETIRELEALGAESDVQISAVHEDIFNAMHTV